MPFLVDDIGLCERALAAALGLAGAPPPEAMCASLAAEVFAEESRFVTSLDASPLAFVLDRRQKGARNFVVRRGLIYIHVKTTPNFAVVVPPHFVTDFASVPMLLRWLAPFDGPASPPAVIHDWLYAVAEPPAQPARFRSERLRADSVFLEAMRTNGVSQARRTVLYRGARVFGRDAFGRPEELRFVDPASGDRLIDATNADKAALRALTILPRPVPPTPRKVSFRLYR